MTKSTQLALPGTATETALMLPDNLSFEDWQSAGEQIARAERAVMWWMGDWWNFGERKYGELAAQAADSTYSYNTWAQASRVSSAIEPCSRLQTLSWSHHQEVAALEPDLRNELLQWADETGATRNELRREIRNRRATANVNQQEFPAGKYGVLYADPPWQYEHSKTDNRRIENHYPTMELADICTLPVPDLAADDCVLFLWATSPKLSEAMEVVTSWGFVYRTQAVWVKPQIGMGYYFRQQHEPLLVAARGTPTVPEPENRPPSVIQHPRGEHSAKPPQIYDVIDAMYPHVPKIELFAREAHDGWDSWGNQLEQQAAG